MRAGRGFLCGFVAVGLLWGRPVTAANEPVADSAAKKPLYFMLFPGDRQDINAGSEEAIAWWKRKTAENPKDARPHDALMRIWIQRGYCDLAIEECERATACKNTAEMQLTLSRLELVQARVEKDWNERLRMLRKAYAAAKEYRRKSRDTAEAEEQLARVFYEMGLDDEALKHCDAAIRYKKHDSDVKAKILRRRAEGTP